MLSIHTAGFKIWSHLWGEAEPSLEGLLLVGPFMTQDGGEWRGGSAPGRSMAHLSRAPHVAIHPSIRLRWTLRPEPKLSTAPEFQV